MLVPYEGARNEGNISIKTLFLALWLVWQMRTNTHDCSQHLNHEQHKEPDHTKGPDRHRALWGVEKPY